MLHDPFNHTNFTSNCNLPKSLALFNEVNDYNYYCIYLFCTGINEYKNFYDYLITSLLYSDRLLCSSRCVSLCYCSVIFHVRYEKALIGISDCLQRITFCKIKIL